MHSAHSESGLSLKHGKENTVGLNKLRAVDRMSRSGSQHLVNMKAM